LRFPDCDAHRVAQQCVHRQRLALMPADAEPPKAE